VPSDAASVDPADLSDQDLLERVLARDAAALERLYARHGSAVLRWRSIFFAKPPLPKN
jgi:hypothetical protein